MRPKRIHYILYFLTLFFVAACKGPDALPPGDADNGGLYLPGGFEAVVVVDSIPGATRHIAVNANGDIYAKLRFPQPGGANVALRDTNNDGRADILKLFGEYDDKSEYGTEMRVHNNYLWFSSVTKIFRQKLKDGELVPTTEMELMLTDTQPPRQHDTKPIAFDKKGNMYIPFGAPSDCCQVNDRTPFSPGMDPCPILETRGGIWRFDANKPNQFQWDGQKYATGLRSIVALAWNEQSDALFTVMHGRDYLHSTWPKYFSEWQGAVLPSEEFLRLDEGADAGWPYYYYDHLQKKKLLNPEYGGDGKTEARGASYTQPVVGFPGHFAPNDLLFYTGDQFPARYKEGAFVAFHGSTSSAPYAQAGYFIAFVPFKNGMPSGEWEVFADGFSGIDTVHNTSDAAYRPMGLAQGPDGSLYISETEKGKMWRVMYKGNRDKFGTAELAAMGKRKAENLSIKTPDEVKDNLDKKVYSDAGKLYNAYCGVCHQRDGKGSGRFPPLEKSEWLMGNNAIAINIILNGLEGEIVVRGRKFTNKMPKLDLLSDEEIAQILTYVRAEFNHINEPVTPEEVGRLRKELANKGPVLVKHKPKS